MMNSSDFYIIKISFCTTKYYMKKFHNGESIGLKKQHEAAENYNNFYWKFIEYVTKKPRNYYNINYFLSARECSEEEILETHGIRLAACGKGYVYHIPKRHTDIIDWIKINIIVNHKELKKSPYVYPDLFEPTTYYRDNYKTEPGLLKLLTK